MSLKSVVDTRINLQSEYSDSSINDSVFFNSNICLVAVIAFILLVIALFLRLSKKIALVESEIIVILRALRISQAFSEECSC